jgi:hypothetical protein
MQVKDREDESDGQVSKGRKFVLNKPASIKNLQSPLKFRKLASKLGSNSMSQSTCMNSLTPKINPIGIVFNGKNPSFLNADRDKINLDI